jgi:hypothetical protein
VDNFSFMPNHLLTVAQVITALGGSKAAANLFNIGQTAVGNWRTRNWLPPHTFPLVQKELLARGLTADISLWRFERKKRCPNDIA